MLENSIRTGHVFHRSGQLHDTIGETLRATTAILKVWESWDFSPVNWRVPPPGPSLPVSHSVCARPRFLNSAHGHPLWSVPQTRRATVKYSRSAPASPEALAKKKNWQCVSFISRSCTCTMLSESDEDFDRRLSLSEKMMADADDYRDKHAKHQAVREEGWFKVDFDDKALRTSYEPPETPDAFISASIAMGRDVGLLDVFLTTFLPPFVGSLMANMLDDSPK